MSTLSPFLVSLLLISILTRIDPDECLTRVPSKDWQFVLQDTNFIWWTSEVARDAGDFLQTCCRQTETRPFPVLHKLITEFCAGVRCSFSWEIYSYSGMKFKPFEDDRFDEIPVFLWKRWDSSSLVLNQLNDTQSVEIGVRQHLIWLYSANFVAAAVVGTR